MRDWNTVVTVRERGFDKAFDLLGEFGPVGKTGYFNVLVMRLADIPWVLETLRDRVTEEAERYEFLSRLVPLTHVFDFTTPHDFEARAREAVLTWRPNVADKTFHVRMHRRGFKGKLSSMEEERFLDETVLEAMREAGSTARLSFEDPDVIIAVETVGERGGLSIWRREELKNYPFLHLD